MSEILTRGITGAVLVIVLIAMSYLSIYSAIAFWALITILAIVELRKNKMGGMLSAIYLLVVCYSLILLGFFSYDTGSFSFNNPSFDTFAYIGGRLLGKRFVKVGLAPNISDTYSGLNLVVFMCVVWANDTFAYIGGRFLGKRFVKVGLAPNISPNKSWEGAVVGSLSASLVGYLFLGIVGAGIAFITSATATLSDLVESKAKRKVGIKDSGNLLPGHGGILDRFDALLLSAPFTFIAVYILSQ